MMVIEPWQVLASGTCNVWPRLAASGSRLDVDHVWSRLDVWTSGRLGHVWARLARLGLYHVRKPSGYVWARLGTSGHVWTSGRLERLVRLVRHHDHFT